jgi:starvation-inducible DNA-binding protein
MELAKLQSVLEETFAGNFVVYYRAHQAHVNVRGRNFYNDHKLLRSIYKTLQDHIDDLGEKLQTVGGTMPCCLNYVIATSPTADTPVEGDADELLREVLMGIETLVDQYHELDYAAEEVEYVDISNMAQENIGELAKMKWQLMATLEMSNE